MFIFRLTLICVLLNTAFAQSDHQLMHLSKNHPVEQCDVCSQTNYFDDYTNTAFTLFVAKFDGQELTLTYTPSFNANHVHSLQARAPPENIAFQITI